VEDAVLSLNLIEMTTASENSREDTHYSSITRPVLPRHFDHTVVPCLKLDNLTAFFILIGHLLPSSRELKVDITPNSAIIRVILLFSSFL
jgi:hypothetical protein